MRTARSLVAAALGSLAGALVVTSAAPASAQSTPAAAPADPAETVKASTATTGKTDIAKGGFVTSTAPKEDDPKVLNDISIGLGGLFSSGNARTIALTTL